MIRSSLLALLLCAGANASGQSGDEPPIEGFLRTEFTPGTSFKLGLGLLFDQATVAVPEWGSGRAGLERRAGWLAAGWMARAATEYAVASNRHVDTSYHTCLCKGFPKRSTHALHAGFLEYNRDGQPVLAIARFSGLAGGSLVTGPMLPGRYGLRDAGRRAAMAFAVDEGFNVLHEFRREIVRTLLLRPARP